MITGRLKELSRLERVFESNEAEFVVVYGRRRVGKTFLIREYFKQKACLFLHATGLQRGAMGKQLEHFSEVMTSCFLPGLELKAPPSWEAAFKTLDQLINNDNSGKKVVIFLDELPWMATRKSGLLEAIDYYWNRYWSANPRIILIACGSSASWLIKNIIYNKGGLHNRSTCELKIDPFHLFEVEAFLQSKKIKLNKRQILELYLAFGGIPYYLKYLEPGLSAAENIQKILFDKNAALQDEFNKLFKSLFKDADEYVRLIKLIASKREGILRSEIEALSDDFSTGGRLSNRLDNLVQANFIASYYPWDRERGEYFKLIDEYCLFYLYWLLPHRQVRFTQDHWLKQQLKASYQAWSGYAFEALCLKHSSQILKALNIKTAEYLSSWRNLKRKEGELGAQIDLLIDRSDDAVTVCEIKYTGEPFEIDKTYANRLRSKIEVFRKNTQTKKQVFLALVSANGLKQNKYSKELAAAVVTLEDLFRSE